MEEGAPCSALRWLLAMRLPETLRPMLNPSLGNQQISMILVVLARFLCVLLGSLFAITFPHARGVAQ